MIKTLRGGSIGRDYAFGPALVKDGYRTTANGWASEIIAHYGEVAAVVQSGSPHSFTRWLVGPVEEVISHLRERPGDEAARLRYVRLAADIERDAPCIPQSLLHRLAVALRMDAGQLAQGIELAKVELSEAVDSITEVSHGP